MTQVEKSQEDNLESIEPNVIPTEDKVELDDPDKIVELAHLNEIEDPKYAGHIIKVDAVVASDSISYSVPKEIHIVCSNDSDDHQCNATADLEIPERYQIQFVEIKEVARHNLLKNIAITEGFQKDCVFKIDEKKSLTLKKTRIRPIVSTLITKDGMSVDDKGNEWKSYDVYIQQDALQVLQAGRELKLSGRVLPDPKNQRVTILVFSVSYKEDVKYNMENIRTLQTLYSNKSLAQIIDWYTEEYEKYSKIIKRRNVALGGFLTFFSPTLFLFDGKTIPGWVKNIIIGDTTTGKSEMIRQQIMLLGAGQIISGETASTVGISGTASQSSSNTWMVEWGPLVLQDKKLLAIDGAHKLRREEWDKLAEAERDGKIKIIKAAKAEAPARTRQIKIMNPVDTDRITTVSMDSFYHPAQSLTNNLQIQSIARTDFAVFVIDDISPDERNIRTNTKHDKRLEYLQDLLKFVWEQKYDIEFTEDAIDEILFQATQLETKFKTVSIPLISNDQKYKLARLSISLANLTCSFDNDFKKLTVTDEHVKYISELIDTEYTKAGLASLVSLSKVNVTDETIAEIILDVKSSLHSRKDVNDVFCKTILKWIAKQQKFTLEQLLDKFELPENNEGRPLIGKLQSLRLIQRKKSFVPTRKLLEIAKMLESQEQNLEGVSPLNYDKEDKRDKTQQTLSGLSYLSDTKHDTSIRKYRCSTCGSTFTTPKTFDEIQKDHNVCHPNHQIQEISDQETK